jgi:hypothetical protein
MSDQASFNNVMVAGPQMLNDQVFDVKPADNERA